MSRANVEICKRVTEALGRLDVEAAIPYLDPEVTFQSAIVSGAEGNTFRGHEGVRAWMAESTSAFEVQLISEEEFRDLGDHVLMLGRLHARGRGSGVEIDSPIGWLSTFRDGLIVRTRGYLDHEEAIEAAALD